MYHHYFEALTQQTGLTGYFCRLIDTVSGAAVTLYCDANGTPVSSVSGVANMAKTDDAGNFDLYVNPGTYHQDIYAADGVTFIRRIPNVSFGQGQTFLDASVGAVSRPMQAKLADIKSAKDFGAIGNGVADDSAALNAFFAALNTANGGFGLIPPGTYKCNSQVSANVAYFNRTHIQAAGARFKPTHSGSGLNIVGVSDAGGGGVTIHGLVIDVQGNTTTTLGFDVAEGRYTVLENCFIEYDIAHADFVPFQFRNRIADNDDTGSVWCSMINSTARQRTGNPAHYVDTIVRLQGQANAFTALLCHFQTTKKAGVTVTTQPGGLNTNSNGVTLQNCHFEGVEDGVFFDIDSDSSPDGLVIAGCRFESMSNAMLKVRGTSYAGQQPPCFVANKFAVGTTEKYIDWSPMTAVTSWNSLDLAQGAPNDQTGMGERCHNQPITYKSFTNLRDVAAFHAYGGHGVGLFEQSGATKAGSWTVRGAGGSILTGADASNPLLLQRVAGLSANATEARNLGGTATLASGTAAVVFPFLAEPDASYRLFLSGNANETLRWGNKATTGFTITSSNGASTATVDWLLVRA